MSVASAKTQIIEMNRRPLGGHSVDEYVDSQRINNPRLSYEYVRHQALYALRMNYAGKHVVKIDPEIFWINSSFGVQEVPHLWEQWAKIRCSILELKVQKVGFCRQQSSRE